MKPFQGLEEIEQYQRRLGMHKAVCDTSFKIWIFWEDIWTAEIIFGNIKQSTLKLRSNVPEVMINTLAEVTITIVYTRCNILERLELWENIKDMAHI